MGKSTERLEKIFKDVEDKARADDGKSIEVLAKERAEVLLERVANMRKTLIFFSNGYLVFTIMSLVFFYIAIVRSEYLICLFDAILFVFSLRNLLESYFVIRAYSGKIQVEVKNDEKD